ncbi:uncharacterized protein LOC141715184 [Apium graveolens]|uniref:uncharacterized protein LOC141715184 n=1 Tax=Apium graveolens TaxID=4045 RepID=UPI003D7A17CD
MTGRLVAWTIELSQFFIEYKPYTLIKSQALSDFVNECQFASKKSILEDNPSRAWLLFIDSSSTVNTGGAGKILISPEGFKVQQALKFKFQVTNNVSEYGALIVGLKLAIELEAKIVDIFGDSHLVAKQVNGEFKTHNDKMASYLARAQEMLQNISYWKISNIDRTENQWGDSLSKLASSDLPGNPDPIYVEELLCPSIDGESINEIQSHANCRKPFMEYILDNKLPE